MSDQLDRSGRACAGVLARLGGVGSPALQEAVVIEQAADVGEVGAAFGPRLPSEL